MYTLRFTRRLLGDVAPAGVEDTGEAPTTSLGDWYVAPVLAKRRTLLLCTSATSLLSVMLPVEHLEKLPEHLAVALVGVLHRLDVPRLAVAAEIDAMTSGDIGAARDRSTMGSMRALAARARAFLAASRGDVDVAALYTHLGEYRSRGAGPHTAAARAVALLTARPGAARRVVVSTFDYQLRRAALADVAALDALIDHSVRGLGRGYYTPGEIEAGLRHVFGVDTQLVTDGTYYLIEHDGVPVACGGWSGRRTLFGGDQHKSGADDYLDPSMSPARIRAFFVHPEHARRGLGRRLYEVCAAAARAAGFHTLELMATLPGVPLYTALGFEPHERVAVATPSESLPCIRMTRSI